MESELLEVFRLSLLPKDLRDHQILKPACEGIEIEPYKVGLIPTNTTDTLDVDSLSSVCMLFLWNSQLFFKYWIVGIMVNRELTSKQHQCNASYYTVLLCIVLECYNDAIGWIWRPDPQEST